MSAAATISGALNAPRVSARKTNRAIRKPFDELPEPAQRLLSIRLARGFETGKDAAQRMGVPIGTYGNHENGARTISQRAAEKYAAFFGVSASFLLHGPEREGDGKKNVKPQVALLGTVGHHGRIDPIPGQRNVSLGQEHTSSLGPLLFLAYSKKDLTDDDIATVLANYRSQILVSIPDWATNIGFLNPPSHVDAPPKVTEAEAKTLAAFYVTNEDLVPMAFPGDILFYRPGPRGPLDARQVNRPRRSIVLSADGKFYACVAVVRPDLRSVTLKALGDAQEHVIEDPIGVWPILYVTLNDPDRTT